MSETLRTGLLLAGAVGSLVYAFIPPGNPAWIATAGALLGGEAVARARATSNSDKKEKEE